MGKYKSFEEINDKIKKGTAVVLNASEVSALAEEMKYGGAHVIEDLIKGKGIYLKAKGKGTELSGLELQYFLAEQGVSSQVQELSLTGEETVMNAEFRSDRRHHLLLREILKK